MSNEIAAAERRRRMIAVLSACTCTWPVRVLRNVSGHDPKCPGHALFLAEPYTAPLSLED